MVIRSVCPLLTYVERRRKLRYMSTYDFGLLTWEFLLDFQWVEMHQNRSFDGAIENLVKSDEAGQKMAAPPAAVSYITRLTSKLRMFYGRFEPRESMSVGQVISA